ncbi:hypothetical protein THASP1DRAFT_31707, partial [Thamnocephalis sphaerospora]
SAFFKRLSPASSKIFEKPSDPLADPANANALKKTEAPATGALPVAEKMLSAEKDGKDCDKSSPLPSPAVARAPWMDPDVAKKIGLAEDAADLEPSKMAHRRTMSGLTLQHRPTLSASGSFSFLRGHERKKSDNFSLHEGSATKSTGESTFRMRFQSAASDFVSSLGLSRPTSAMSLNRPAGVGGTTESGSPPQMPPLVPPPRMSSRSHLSDATRQDAENKERQKQQKEYLIEQLRLEQEENERKAMEDGEAHELSSKDHVIISKDTAETTADAAETKRRKSVRKSHRSILSRQLPIRQQSDASWLEITVQLDESNQFQLQAMPNVEYASLRASIWAELIRRQLPESLFAGKALVYRGTHGELTVGGDGPLHEAVEDSLGGGHAHIVFYCV